MTSLIQEKISVILTMHNDAEHVRSSIDSILAQTYSCLELIVVDDGSTDESAGLVSAIADDRIVLVQPGRVGRGKALNAGIARSTGEFIAIQDSDDLSHPERLEVQVQVLKGSDIDFLGAAAILFEDDLVPSWTSLSGQSTSPIDVTDELTVANPIPHISLMMRRTAVDRLQGYNENRRALFDYDFLIRAAEKGYRLYRLPISLAAKRIHAQQQFEKGGRARYVIEMLRLQRQAITALNRNSWMIAAFPLIFCYRMLPRGVRMMVQRKRSLYNARST